MTPLRARMIADMFGRNLGPASQCSHLRACKRFAAWLGRSPETATNAGHVSLDQLKALSAIERCRTAALGGHVTRCADCAHKHIA